MQRRERQHPLLSRSGCCEWSQGDSNPSGNKSNVFRDTDADSKVLPEHDEPIADAVSAASKQKFSVSS